MSKEDIYDNQINPLMAQIIEICKAHNIAFVASFAIPSDSDPDLFCSSKTPDEAGKFPHHLGDMAAAIDRARGARSNPMMMLTTEHADGSKTMTAIVDGS